mmetsp:Transcript_45705/g.118132  ORF Transcript_45705/g.118132 Transcript_45705/m.118132 type:complete len:281 (-) Transcript_45705:766-1608(-)
MSKSGETEDLVFPPPPPFFQLFEDEDFSLPPPPPPTGTTIKVFNEFHELTPEPPDLISTYGVEDMLKGEKGLKQSFLSVLDSTMSSYLNLLRTLEEKPEEFEQGCNSVEAHFINLHAALNRMRPYQARESLVGILQDQVHERKAVKSILNTALAQGAHIFEGSASKIRDAIEAANKSLALKREKKGDDGREGEGSSEMKAASQSHSAASVSSTSEKKGNESGMEVEEEGEKSRSEEGHTRVSEQGVHEVEKAEDAMQIEEEKDGGESVSAELMQSIAQYL